MARTVSREDLIAAFERRYDFYSARVILAEACAAAGLNDEQSYRPAQVRALRGAVEEVGAGVRRVLEALDRLLDGTVALDPEPEPVNGEARDQQQTEAPSL